MNEHIKALAKEHFCSTEFNDGTVHECYEFSEVELAKFAELLVQECATYLNVAVEVHNQNEQDVCDRAARAIKRYFGVNDGD
jgi:hypothetical protein